MGKIISGIINNNVPHSHLGVMMHNNYGIRPSFKTIKGKVIFQAGIKLDFVEHLTEKVLFNYTTATDFEIDKTIEDEGFFELVNSYILTAIDDFNRYIKAEKGFLINGKFYPKDISLANSKEAIIKAWSIRDMKLPSSN